MEPEIGLADAVSALRDELAEAVSQGVDAPLRFELGPIEMEFLVEARKDSGAEGGVKFWVVSLGGKASAGITSSHRVKLVLSPRDAYGNSSLISDDE